MAGITDRTSQPHGEPPLARHALRRGHLVRERRKVQFARAALVGLAAGLLAVGFQRALWLAEQCRSTLLAWLRQFPTWGWLVLPLLAAALGALASWITVRRAPEASGSGIPHVKGVLLHVRALRWRQLLPVKFLAGVLAIGAGFSLGREGPSVQMGAAAGDLIGDVLHAPRRERRHLIACGSGAGLAAAFNAPLAGFIFVIEELQRELSTVTYGTALIAAVVADVLTRACTGQLPSFHVTGYPMPPLSALPLFALLGLAAGVVGVGFNRGLLATLSAFHRWNRLPPWGRAALVGALVGLVGWWMPEALGGGHHTAEALLRGEYNSASLVRFLLPLLAVKMALTLLSYATGVPGGIFAPLLVLGALVGLITGNLSTLAFPALAPTPAAFAVVGMAATFTAIVRAPLTGVVLILEMTNNYGQLLPLLVACLLAYLVAERLRSAPVYEALLEYDLARKGVNTAHSEPLLLEMVVEPDSPLAGRRVRAAGFPPGCLLVTIRRAGAEIVPSGDTLLEPGDHLTVVISGDVAGGCAAVSALARAVA